MAEGMGGKMLGWVEAHPTESIIIGVGGAVVLMWLLGVFGSSSSSNSGASNMAAAYYAAEAQQAVVGGQIQVASIQATRDQAIAAAGDTAATGIAQIQANAATTINGQNASTTTALGTDNLLATYSNNNTTVATNAANNAAAVSINAANNYTSRLTSYYNTILPSEIAQGGGWSAFIPGIGGVWGSNQPNPNQLAAAGFTPAGIAQQFGGVY